MPNLEIYLEKTSELSILGIISLAHAPVNVTDFSIGSINCNLYPELSFPLRYLCQRSFYKIFVKFRNSKKMYLRLF